MTDIIRPTMEEKIIIRREIERRELPFSPQNISSPVGHDRIIIYVDNTRAVIFSILFAGISQEMVSPRRITKRVTVPYR